MKDALKSLLRDTIGLAVFLAALAGLTIILGAFARLFVVCFLAGYNIAQTLLP